MSVVIVVLLCLLFLSLVVVVWVIAAPSLLASPSQDVPPEVHAVLQRVAEQVHAHYREDEEEQREERTDLQRAEGERASERASE